MKKDLPDPNFSYGELFRLPYEAVKWEVLKTAIELEIFERLTEPETATGLASRLSTHEANTEHLLKALVGLGLLVYSNGYYGNSPISETFLTTNKDTSIGKALLFMSGWTSLVLNGGMMNLVRKGPSSTGDFSDESIWEAGARASLNHSRCGRAQMIAEQVAALPEFPSFSRMLDLGAGPGVIGVAVTAAHPKLNCIVFDQEAVCAVSKEVITEYGMEDRVQTMSGDYMNDPIGDNYDFVMANFTLNFYQDRLDDVIAKVHDALQPGGVFMVSSDGLNKDKTAPAASVISWLPTCLQGKDMSFRRGVISNAMLRAGFVSTESRIVTDVELEAHGPVDVIIGRKSNGA